MSGWIEESIRAQKPLLQATLRPRGPEKREMSHTGLLTVAAVVLSLSSQPGRDLP